MPDMNIGCWSTTSPRRGILCGNDWLEQVRPALLGYSNCVCISYFASSAYTDIAACVKNRIPKTVASLSHVISSDFFAC